MAEEIAAAEAVVNERKEQERKAQEEANRRARLDAEVKYSQRSVQSGQVASRRKKRKVYTPGDSYTVPFGKHKGKRLKEVPIGYVKWAAGEMDGFRGDVFRAELERRQEASRQ